MMGRFPLCRFAPNKWLISAALGLILLPGCAKTIQAPPGIEVRKVEVIKPVAVACVKVSDLPSEPPKIAGKLTGDARRDLDLVSASAIRLRAWGSELRAMLKGCAS
jgi:hypothetical protein